MRQRASQQPPLVSEEKSILGACVSTKGSCFGTTANPSGEELDTDMMKVRGLYYEDKHSTCLVAFGKVYEGALIVHYVHLTNDVVNVCVEEVRDANCEVSVPTLEVQLVRQVVDSFIAWLRLVKPISHEVFT